MNADRRDTIAVASLAFGLNLRARRSRGTVCWGIRDLAIEVAEELGLGPEGAKYVIAAGLVAFSIGAYHHLALPIGTFLKEIT